MRVVSLCLIEFLVSAEGRKRVGENESDIKGRNVCLFF